MENIRSFVFKENFRIVKSKDKIVLGNRENGRWLRISAQCFDILKIGIDNNWTVENLLGNLADDSDREYFTKLFSKLDELGIIRYSNESEPKIERTVDFAITHRCNLNCKHCCVEADDLHGKEYLTTEEVLNAIDKIIVSNPTDIIITGGEAMVRKDFFEILKYTYDHFPGKIVLMTNGTLINQENVSTIIKYIGAIDVSLDGVDEESCSKIRGKGVFTKVINTIKLLQDNNFFKISTSMVITRENQHLRQKFIELNETLKTKAIPRIFSPIGRGAINEKQFETRNNGEIEIVSSKIYSHKEILDNIKVCHCSALSKTIYINYKGDIFPCGLFEKDEYCLGNIFEIENIKSFYENKLYIHSKGYKALQKVQPENYEYCKDCDVNLFCWNCLHFLDLYGANRELMNQKCIDCKKELQRHIWRDN